MAGKQKLVGIGAGGHARVILDILRQAGEFDIVGLTDADPALHGTKVEGALVLGSDEVLRDLAAQGVHHLFLGVGGTGDNRPRAAVFDRLIASGFEFVSAIHRRATVAGSARIAGGAVIMAGAIVNPGVTVGRNVIINTGAVVDHDCVLEDHVHVAPGAVISGGVRIGRGTHIGTGAAVKQGVTLGDHVVVGVGAAVIEDVPAGAVVGGVPARALQRKAREA